MKVLRPHWNYMIGSAAEGHCNPYANAPDGTEDDLGQSPTHVRIAAHVASSVRRMIERSPSKSQIQIAARELLEGAWRRQKAELGHEASLDPFEVINPERVLKEIGYRVEEADTLGQFLDSEGAFEIAGEIDPSRNSVRVSRQILLDARRFTLAHELGHAILHRGMALHRDRPVDGTAAGRRRDPKEVEADHFAACFLMPAVLVKKEFAARFLTHSFGLTEEVAFALALPDLETARRVCGTREELARLLAGTRFFNGKHFLSLAEQFKVSVKAMAIRLLEVGLVAGAPIR